MITVILVEDDAMLRPILARTLTDLGYTVEAVTSANTALALLRAHPVDLVISDIRLAGVSGCALVRDIAIIYPAVRTGLISGYPNDHLLNDAECAPSMPLLVKPFKRTDLADWLTMLLEHPPWSPCPEIRKEDR